MSKLKFLVYLLFFSFNLSVFSQTNSITLAWDAPTNSDISGYNLYYGSASEIYTNVTFVGNVTNATLSYFTSGDTYYFAATTLGTNGLESVYSSEVSYTVPQIIKPIIGPTIIGTMTIPIIPYQYNFLSNPFDNGTNNLTSLLPNPPFESMVVYLTNGVNLQSVFYEGNGIWSDILAGTNVILDNHIFPPGVGFFFLPRGQYTATFSGKIIVPIGGSTTNFLSAGLNLVGSQIPFIDSLNGSYANFINPPLNTEFEFRTNSSWLISYYTNNSWQPNQAILPATCYYVSCPSNYNWIETLSSNEIFPFPYYITNYNTFVKGYPEIESTSSVSTSGGTSVLNKNIVASGNNSILLFLVDWYPGTIMNNIPTFNNSSSNVSLLNNFIWYSSGKVGKGAIYYLSNPINGSYTASISWPSNIDEASLTAIVLTNCSGFDNAITNYTSSSSSTISITSPSSTNDLMIFYSVLSDTGHTPTMGGGQTIISQTTTANGQHQNVISIKQGTNITDTSSVNWSNGNSYPSGSANFGAKGF
jgi:hypothetical protein